MNSFFQNLSSFLKRYVIVIIICIIAGNLIVWLNGEEGGQFYQTMIRAKCRADYYDAVRGSLEKLSKTISDTTSTTSALKEARIETYRNEEFYFTDFKLRFRDTAAALPIINVVMQSIKSDEDLRSLYFDRLENIDKLIADCKNLIFRFNESMVSGVEESLDMREKLFRAKTDLENLISTRDDLRLKVSFSFPVPPEYKLVNTGNSPKTYATASILFLIIGLFAAVVLDRFRN